MPSSAVSSHGRARPTVLWVVLALVASSLALLPTTTAHAAPTPGAVAGTVVDDLGAPAVGVCVYVQSSFPSYRTYNTTTGADGRYSVSNVAPDNYLVTLFSCDGMDYLSDHTSLTVASGTTATFDAALTRAAKVSGVVTDDHGGAIEGICVLAYNEGSFTRNAFTSSTGFYRVGGLDPSTYKVQFQPCSPTWPNWAIEWWDDARTEAGAATLPLAAGEEATGIDAALAPGVEVNGVVTANSQPLPYACVTAHDPSGTRLGFGGYATSTGYYRITALPAGDYKIRFEDCSAPWSGRSAYATEWWNDQRTSATATTVSLDPGETATGINAALTPGSVLNGVVTNADGAPLSNVCVEVFTGDLPDPPVRAWTTITGYYAVGGLASTAYKIHADECSGDNYVGEWYADAPTRQMATPVPVTAPATVSGIDFALAPTGGIEGVVSDVNGDPLEDICVAAYETAGNDAVDLVLTSVTGNYNIGGLAAGPHQVEFDDCGDHGLPGEWFDDKPSRAAATPVTVVTGSDATANAVLGHAPAAPSAVRAVGGNGAATVTWTPPTGPVSGYQVVATPGGTTVDAAGTATGAVLSGLANGTTYTFTVTAVNAAGRGPASGASNAVTPSPPASTTIVVGGGTPIVVEPGQPLVVTGDGYPPHTDLDVVVNSTPRLLATVRTDADGRFSVTLLLPADLALGVHTLSVTGPAPGGGTRRIESKLHVVVDLVATGYRFVAADGGVFSFGAHGFHGSTGGTPLNRPIVAAAATPSKKGYWLVASDGGVFAFGDARFLGSTGGITLNQPIVGMASTPTGNGYWLVARDGGMFAFGDAAFRGSMGGQRLNQPIVGMAASPTGDGYWMVARDGGIFAFGAAGFRGSMGGSPLNQPIVGMTAAPTGDGYWMVASDGGIFAFGSAAFHGSTGGTSLNRPIVGMATTPTGDGYWLVASDGGVFAFDAPFLGSTGGQPLAQPVVAVAG